MQLCTFDGSKVVWFEENLNWVVEYIWAYLRVLKVIWVYWGCKDTFELNWTWCEGIGRAKARLKVRGFDVNKWKRKDAFELTIVCFVWFEDAMPHWVEESMISVYWDHKDTSELKRACFEWFESWNAYLSSRGPWFEWCRDKFAHYNRRWHDLSRFREQR